MNGNHWCLNFTTEEKGKAGAVLVRALEPLEGIEEMAKRRGTTEIRNLTSGPGKLAEALGIDGRTNGEDSVTSKRLYVVQGKRVTYIATSARIGISRGTEQQWRYYIRETRTSPKARDNYRFRAS